MKKQFFTYSKVRTAKNLPLIDGNDDLFWAVMGGSPGCFGVVTHVLFCPMHDKDYPDSRMMKTMTLYTQEKHQKLEQLLAEAADDPDFPRNFDCTITVMTDRSLSFETKDSFEKRGETLNLDEYMMFQHPEQVSVGQKI